MRNQNLFFAMVFLGICAGTWWQRIPPPEVLSDSARVCLEWEAEVWRDVKGVREMVEEVLADGVITRIEYDDVQRRIMTRVSDDRRRNQI